MPQIVVQVPEAFLLRLVNGDGIVPRITVNDEAIAAVVIQALAQQVHDEANKFAAHVGRAEDMNMLSEDALVEGVQMAGVVLHTAAALLLSMMHYEVGRRSGEFESGRDESQEARGCGNPTHLHHIHAPKSPMTPHTNN